MTDDVTDLFDAAAGYVAKLAAVEHAHILGDEQEIDYLLSGVDPIDARFVANQLRNLVKGLRGVSTDAPSAGESPTVSPRSPLSVASASSGGTQASAPDTKRKPW